MLLDDLSIDTAWCPVCDRAIIPNRVDMQLEPSPQPLPPSRQRKNHPVPPGLVNGTGRALRRTLPAVKTRSVVSSDLSYYCSEDCRLQDLRQDLELASHLDSLSLYPSYSSQDIDDDHPRLRVPPPPSNTPAEGYFHSPSSPHFHSSGTESDASSLEDAAASYSPTKVLRELPPIKSRSRNASQNTLSEIPTYQGGVMVAAQRIQDAFSSVVPSKPGSPRGKQLVIKGWTDGDRTEWRSSVYGGERLTSEPRHRASDIINNYSGGSYMAQGARRAAGITDVQPRRHPSGQSAPQLRNLHENRLAFTRNASSSQLSSDDGGSPIEETIHPLLSTPLRGKLLVPELQSRGPSRSNSSHSLSSLRKDSVLARSPLGQYVALPTSLTIPAQTESQSWSCNREQMYKLPPRLPRKEKRIQNVWVPSPRNNSGLEGLGEGRWEKKQVEVEVQPERQPLFRFGS